MSVAPESTVTDASVWPTWVANHVQLGLIVLDLQGRVRLFNRWMVDSSGLALDQVVGRSVFEVFPELPSGRIGRALRDCLETGLPAVLSNSLNPTPFPLFSDAHNREQGVRRQQSVRISRPLRAEGADAQVLIEVTDVSNAVRRERLLQEQALELRNLSSHDVLTGLANRRRLNEVLDREFRRASRGKRPIAVVMIDIDLFKPFNDTYGHPAGDQCLIDVAHTMRTLINRPTDLVARYGGEEFIVVLPDTDLDGAVAVAQELRLSVHQMGIAHDSSTHDSVVTISQGVAAVVPAVADSFESLISKADVALYAAKRAGRNRIAALRGAAQGAVELISLSDAP